MIKIEFLNNDNIALCDKTNAEFGEFLAKEIEAGEPKVVYYVTSHIAILSLRVAIKKGLIKHDEVFIVYDETNEIYIDENTKLSDNPKCLDVSWDLMIELLKNLNG